MNREIPLNVKDLAESIGRGRSYINAMRFAGYVFTHGNRTLVSHALKWLRNNPDFRSTAYRMKAGSAAFAVTVKGSHKRYSASDKLRHGQQKKSITLGSFRRDSIAFTHYNSPEGSNPSLTAPMRILSVRQDSYKNLASRHPSGYPERNL